MLGFHQVNPTQKKYFTNLDGFLKMMELNEMLAVCGKLERPNRRLGIPPEWWVRLIRESPFKMQKYIQYIQV